MIQTEEHYALSRALAVSDSFNIYGLLVQCKLHQLVYLSRFTWLQSGHHP